MYLNRDDRPGDADLETDRAAFAEAHRLRVIDDHLALPDLRIEDETAEGELDTGTWRSSPSTTRAASSAARRAPASPATARPVPQRRKPHGRHALRSPTHGTAHVTLGDRAIALEYLGFTGGRPVSSPRSRSTAATACAGTTPRWPACRTRWRARLPRPTGRTRAGPAPDLPARSRPRLPPAPEPHLRGSRGSRNRNRRRASPALIARKLMLLD